MASRRIPLGAVPNAVNSPVRSIAGVNGKRTRAQAGDQRDSGLGQPPTKKHIIEAPGDGDGIENVDPRRRNAVAVIGQDKLDEPFSRRNYTSQPTALERKFASARERKTTPQSRNIERSHRHHVDNLESIRQWQKHYKRQFPNFVFYFDNVSDDTRHKAMRQISVLSAREEKFFSKAVTHVITTRSIPSEATSTSPDEDGKYDGKYDATPMGSAPSVTLNQRRTTSLLDANLQRRSQPPTVSTQPSIDNRKPQSQGADILYKARALGIKIWALEKLQRVLTTIHDTDSGDQTTDYRSHATTRVTRTTNNADLEQLLRHEKVRGPADRDMNVATQDMITLKNCYIYINDMDEKTKPVMAREYPKPPSKEQGKWPQFRLSGSGRCPFIEDPNHAKKMALQQEREAQAAQTQELDQRKTRASASLHAMPPQILGEREANLRRSPRKLAQAAKPQASRSINPPPGPTMRQSSAEVLPAFFNSTAVNLRGMPRMVRGEPVASGIQPPSNVTSAIRSQAISSAAISSTAPGLQRRVGDTKEVSLLKRKALASHPSSYVNDVRAAINDDHGPAPRAAKRKAQETLGVVHEDDEANENASRATTTSAPKRKKAEKEAKPGYCENCRDKFEDFDEHILSRKHRKFAMAPEHWAELDALLGLLKRPHKKD